MRLSSMISSWLVRGLGACCEAVGRFSSDVLAIKHLDDMNDDRLVAIARSDPERGRYAYEVLVRRNQDWLVSLLIYLLGRRDLAEDVAQDVFLRAYLALSSYRGTGTFRGWLRTIAMRQAFNRRRDASTRLRYHEQLVAERLSAEEYALEQEEYEDWQLVTSILANLPYLFREVLLLRYVEEMSVVEIGELLDIGVSAVKMRLSRARDAFRREMIELGDREG